MLASPLSQNRPVIARVIGFVLQNASPKSKYRLWIAGNLSNVPLSVSFHHEKEQFCETRSEFVNKRLTSGGWMREDAVSLLPLQ